MAFHETDSSLSLSDILSWFKENMILPPSIDDLKTIMQALLNANRVVEISPDCFLLK